MKLPAGRKALLLGVPVGLAFAGAMAFMQLSGGTPPPPVPDPGDGQHGVMLALEDRVVNLRTGGPYRYAKVALTIELRPETADYYTLASEARAAAETEAVAAESAAMPLLIDAVGTIVASADPTALTTPEGRTILKVELLGAIRSVLGEEEVLDLYFTDFVMQ